MTSSPNEIPYIYIYLYSKLKERCFDKIYLDTDTVLKIIRNSLYHTPNKQFIYAILKELENYGLVRKIHRLKYEIIDSRIDKKIKSLKEEEFNKILSKINSQGVIQCYDKSLYQIIPSRCIKRLQHLNAWILE